MQSKGIRKLRKHPAGCRLRQSLHSKTSEATRERPFRLPNGSNQAVRRAPSRHAVGCCATWRDEEVRQAETGAEFCWAVRSGLSLAIPVCESGRSPSSAQPVPYTLLPQGLRHLCFELLHPHELPAFPLSSHCGGIDLVFDHDEAPADFRPAKRRAQLRGRLYGALHCKPCGRQALAGGEGVAKRNEWAAQPSRRLGRVMRWRRADQKRTRQPNSCSSFLPRRDKRRQRAGRRGFGMQGFKAEIREGFTSNSS